MALLATSMLSQCQFAAMKAAPVLSGVMTGLMAPATQATIGRGLALPGQQAPKLSLDFSRGFAVSGPYYAAVCYMHIVQMLSLAAQNCAFPLNSCSGTIF